MRLRGWRRGAAVVALATVAASGCAPSQDPALIADSRWVLTAADAVEVPAGQVYLRFEGHSATLVTQPEQRSRFASPSCAFTVFEVALGPDGQLTFPSSSDGTGLICEPGMAEVHLRVAEALSATESWQVTGDRLDLAGGSDLRFTRDGD